MPGDNGLWFGDNQDVAPCGPKTAEQNPEYLIPDSQLKTRVFSLEYAQLLTEGKDCQVETVTGMEEGVEEGHDAAEKWNQGPGFMARGPSQRLR